jgi:iron complex outermembrane receptor protein
METGATYNSGNLFRKIFVELIGTAYYSKIYNMISWSPSSESSAIWISENVDEIFNRGIEASLNLELTHNKWKFKSMNNYNFCLSTYEKVNSPNDEKLGKQQIFIPVHTFNTALTIDWQNFYLRYNFVYTGERYTSKDNANVMPGYALSNIIFGKHFKMNIINLSLQLDINNLFNLDYQSLPSRPMPGINQMLTIRVTFPGSR